MYSRGCMLLLEIASRRLLYRGLKEKKRTHFPRLQRPPGLFCGTTSNGLPLLPRNTYPPPQRKVRLLQSHTVISAAITVRWNFLAPPPLHRAEYIHTSYITFILEPLDNPCSRAVAVAVGVWLLASKFTRCVLLLSGSSSNFNWRRLVLRAPT